MKFKRKWVKTLKKKYDLCFNQNLDADILTDAIKNIISPATQR